MKVPRIITLKVVRGVPNVEKLSTFPITNPCKQKIIVHAIFSVKKTRYGVNEEIFDFSLLSIFWTSIFHLIKNRQKVTKLGTDWGRAYLMLLVFKAVYWSKLIEQLRQLIKYGVGQ